MKITPNQTFKHEKETYEKGKEYDVPGELAHYFANVGWAGTQDQNTVTLRKSDVGVLKIQDGTLGQKSEVK